MKYVMILLLTAVMAVSKIVAASDTLWIDSYRVVNTCSGEQRWVFSVWIGEVYFSDSLMSFDITIGYDTTHLRPTTGLWLGTLADQMRFADLSPYINLIVPGEIRVGAFTITTPVKGNLPLFAVAGDFKGTCLDRDTFSLPFEPTFNEEFKGKISYFRTDTVIAVATPSNNGTQGAEFEEDSVVLSGRDSIVSADFVIRLSDTPAEQYAIDVRIMSPLPAEIDSVSISADVQTDSVVYSADKTKATAYITGIKNAGIVGTVHLRSVTDDTISAQMVVETRALGNCLCTIPTLRDTIGIYNVKQPIVSVESDVHADFEITVIQNSEGIQIQNHHGQPGIVNVVSVLGNTVSTATFDSERIWLSLDSLSRGVYYVVVTVSGRYQVTKIEI